MAEIIEDAGNRRELVSEDLVEIKHIPTLAHAHCHGR